MSIESLGEAKDLVVKYLHSTYQNTGEHHGWGISKDKSVSVTNTCEAILTFDQLEALQDSLLLREKENIITYLTKSLLRGLDAETVRIRDIAYPMLALNMLGMSEHKEKSVAKLISLADRGGGWSEKTIAQYSSLVPTYHAMFSLQRLGETVDEKHYTWLSTLQKSHLCSFNHDDEPSFGASSLVLYLVAHSQYTNLEWVQRLTKKIKEELPKMIDKMHSKDRSWMSYDKYSTFYIHGYGHALSALNSLGEDLFHLNLQKFLATINHDAFHSQNATIPAVLELSVALRSVRLNFDPFRYLIVTREQITQSVKSELDSQRSLLMENEEKLKLHHALIDEWEKDIIRQRHEIPQIVISELNLFFNTQRKNFLRAALYYSSLSVLFLGGIFAIWERRSENKALSWADFFLTVLTLVPIIVELFRWYYKRKEGP